MTEQKRFTGRSKTITVGRHSATIENLLGWLYPNGDAEFDADSAERFMAEQDRLVLLDRYDREWAD